jgi:hypothetical protein
MTVEKKSAAGKKPSVYRFKIKATGGGLTQAFDIPDVSEADALLLVCAIYRCINSPSEAAKEPDHER